MTSSELRKKYLEFFVSKGHKIVPSASLVPDNDPTTLFTSAGMQPLLPYLLGEIHPEGKRIVDSQKVFRSQDIEEVGDRWHDTFFEMLGNWSFGDYWKKEQLEWIFNFLTETAGVDPQNIYVTAFIGDPSNNLPRDKESVLIWQDLFKQKGVEDPKVIEIGSVENGNQQGMQGGRIFYYDAKKNWWSRSGEPKNMPAGEPGGPDSEMFYQFTNVEHDLKFGPECHPNCDCGRFVEIGNSVFMQYIKQANGSFAELPNKNVDFGGGLERISAASEKKADVFETDAYLPIIEKLSEQTGKSYAENKKEFKVIADHIKAATFLIKDGVLPSNKLQGYILRRLLRRAAVKMNSLKEGSMELLPKLVDPVLDVYAETEYFQIGDWNQIKQVIAEEINKFQKTLKQGLREMEKVDKIDGQTAFNLYQSYGFPIEITAEIAKERGQEINMEEYQQEVEKHRQLSQTTSAGIFKGGLADHSDESTKLHTATHLLQAATKQILGDFVGQRGSNITEERLRWDFNYPSKLTDEEIKQIEDLVNQKIQEDLSVHFDIENREDAIKNGATTNHGESYPDNVKVYKIDEFSKELCGGPHVDHTAVLGHFKIIKEEGVSTGVRRIYATVN